MSADTVDSATSRPIARRHLLIGWWSVFGFGAVGLVLELLHFADPGAQAPYRARTMNEPGLTHLSISVDDVRAAAAKVVEHGGEIIEESDVGLALFVRDPDGQLLELLPADYRDRLPPKP